MKRTIIHDFDTITLEGAIFVIDQLEKALQGNASSQSEKDYHVPRGFRLTDEFGRSFQIAQAIWRDYHATIERSSTESFALEFLRDALGYADIAHCDPPELGGRIYPIRRYASPAVPLVIVPGDLTLDTPDELFAVQGSGARRKSGTQMLQEYLNAGGAGWGIALNRITLRLLRASRSLVRPAWLEFDIAEILSNQRYPDYCAFYRIMHASRAPRIWQKWWEEGAEQGVRVREGLRKGVTKALQIFGSGFLSGSGEGNARLRTALEQGELSKEAFFSELLRLVYRLLFIFTAEERGILHASPNSELHEAKDLYARGYSCARLKEYALRRAGWNSHVDLWEGLKVIFRALAQGEPALDLPALGGLFAPDQCPHLDACTLTNRALLEAMLYLRWTVSGDKRVPVDYRNMGPEELGSVYESLLELVPSVDCAGRSFSFIGLDEEGSTAGNARKTTGSYYTPEVLVHELIRSALDPVIEAHLAKHPQDPEKALLQITVCDPACGSGHFLLAAGRRLAEQLAVVRSEDGSVTPEQYRHALREIVANCLYGVDYNPMAVELARTALWLEGFEPGKPLSFLDHHIRCGNSLVGVFNLEVLQKGIPSAAYSPLTGDDPEYARKLKKRNQTELVELKKGQAELFESVVERAEAALTQLHWCLETIGSETLGDIEAKRQAFLKLTGSREYRAARAACDIWAAAFFAPKQANVPVPTSADVARAVRSEDAYEFSAGVAEYAARLSQRHRFFHWKLEFPEVFARGGFDCVLGNPPWERIKLQEEEFFAVRAPAIANARNKSERGRLIEALSKGNELERLLYAEFHEARRFAEAVSLFVHCPGEEGGRYPLTGIGDVNMYALFAELFLHLHRVEYGRAGFIVPSGIASDNSTKDYFAHIATKGRLVSLFDFENRAGIFPAVDSRMKFCLMTIGASSQAQFAFFLHDVKELEDQRQRFVLTPLDFEHLNPNTRTCPIFRSAKDAELTRAIYERVPVLWQEKREGQPERNPWGIAFSRMIDMANDSGLFHTSPGPGLVPLYEAKLIHQFDHRFATFDPALAKGTGDSETEGTRETTDAEKADPTFAIRPRYWVDRREVIARLADAPASVIKAWHPNDAADLRAALEAPGIEPELAKLAHAANLFDAVGQALERRCPKWLMGWRNITNATNETTIVIDVFPAYGIGNSLPLILFPNNISAKQASLFLGNQISLVQNFIARNKIGGTNFNFFYMKQLPILPPEAYTPEDIAFIAPRVFELTWTAYDIAGWAEDLWNSMDAHERALVLGAHRTNQRAARNMQQPYAFIEPEFMPSPNDPLLETSFDTTVLPPFVFLHERRACIRAELDAYYARLYGLSRDDLRYILDPQDLMGPDYPSETFRVLKEKEIARFGEYRTRRLVLEAWDRLVQEKP
jgi:hypothetical protein